MTRTVWLTNSNDFCDFMDKEVAAGRNPTTPNEWEAWFERFREATANKVICLGYPEQAVETLKLMKKVNVQ